MDKYLKEQIMSALALFVLLGLGVVIGLSY